MSAPKFPGQGIEGGRGDDTEIARTHWRVSIRHFTLILSWEKTLTFQSPHLVLLHLLFSCRRKPLIS